jgi:phosphoinositide-3-kinase regulatory subunit 4
MQHYNSDIASVLTYCTMRGGVRSWDLRCATEPFKLPIPAELGYSTSIALAPDRNWIAVGTSKGCVALWDIRYNVMSKLWQHSSASTIHRIATCKSIGSVNNSMTSREYPEGAYLFVAAGRNETGVWGVPEGGECIRCFRTLPPPPPDSAIPTGYYHAITPLPVLRDVPVPSSSHSRYFGVRTLPRESAIMEPSVRAIIGRISVSGTSYVVNAGTDKCIRFWDFNSPSKCYTVSGLDVAQPKPLYATPDVEGYRGNLFVCYDTAMPSLDNTLQSHIPLREGRGVAPQSGNVSFKVFDHEICCCKTFMNACNDFDCFICVAAERSSRFKGTGFAHPIDAVGWTGRGDQDMEINY